MKRSFLAGLAILLPFIITVIIVVFLFDLLTEPFTKSIKTLLDKFARDPVLQIEHEKFLLFLGKLATLIILFFVITVIGFLARRFIFKWLVDQLHQFLMKIPYLKKLYHLVQQVVKSFIPAEEKEIFKGTVVMKFPHEKADIMGLLSGDAPIVAKRALNEEELQTVFVPTAPHPVSGFLIMTAARNFKKIDVSTEQAIKFLLSCGIVHPGDDNENKES